jgi:glycosyltransferase involved in cell wall biosynthesis
MDNRNKVSVILTSYNHEKYIKQAIDSVLSQTFTDFELIIWDDASTDSSWDIIQSYSDPRIQAFRNDVNRCGGNTKKAITEVSTGEYIAIHHSDDIWEPSKLEKQVAFLNANPKIGAVFTQVNVIDENDKPFLDKTNFYYQIFEQPNRSRFEWLNYFFYNGNALCHPSVLIRKKCYDECGLYRLGMAQIPDFDMWVRLCMKYEIHVLPEKLVRFRVRENKLNASASIPETRIRSRFEHFQMYNNFRSIKTAEEFVKVFPNSIQYIKQEGYDIGFALGMAALEGKPINARSLFGLILLFEVINNPERARIANQLYGFTNKGFLALTGKQDVFSIEEVASLAAKIANQKGKIANQKGKIANQEAKITSQEAKIANQEVKIASQEAIQRTRTWKLVFFINGLIDKGFPPNSSRRKAARKLYKVISFPYNRLVSKKKLKKENVIIKSSGLFDEAYYLDSNPDVARSSIDSITHYLLYGVAEGRNPSKDFNTRAYLRSNPDVVAIGANPLVHYILHGKSEGREQNPRLALNLSGSSSDYSRANYLSYREIQTRLLLTNQQLVYPYSDKEIFVIGAMESIRNSLAKKYINLPQELLVSIIMPTYNRAAIIRDAIDSVLAQKYRNWELIIVDDNGSDNTEEIIKEINDPRIKYIRNEKNVGCAGARNVGLQHARGDYIGYLDSDNLLQEDFILIMTQEMTAKPQFDVMYCAQKLMRVHQGNVEEKGIRFANFHRPTLENHNYIDAGVIFHRKSCIEKYRFNDKIRTWEDWNFLIQVTEEKPAYAVPCILAEYYFYKTSDQLITTENTKPAEMQIDAVIRTEDVKINIPSSVIDTELLYSPKTIIKPVKLAPVSIVIPSYDCLEYLKTCLRSIVEFSQNVDYEVVVVDNASCSDVINYLRTLQDKDHFSVIFNEKNFGFTRAVNQGILASKPANDVILLNNDTLVTRGWIEAFQEVKANYPEVGLIVPAQVVLPGEKTLLIHRPSSNAKREMDVNISMHHGNVIDPVFDVVNGYIEVSFAPFFCTYFPRLTINEAGLLDEDLGAHYYSDHFYCDLVREVLKKRIIYTPKSKVYHFVQRSTNSLVSKNKDSYLQMLDKKW